jgi:hypothetical protein
MIVDFSLLWQKMAVGVVETAFFFGVGVNIPKNFKTRACYLCFSSYLCSPFCARSVKSPEKQA